MAALIFLKRNGVQLAKSDSLIELTVDCAADVINLPDAAERLGLLVRH